MINETDATEYEKRESEAEDLIFKIKKKLKKTEELSEGEKNK